MLNVEFAYEWKMVEGRGKMESRIKQPESSINLNYSSSHFMGKIIYTNYFKDFLKQKGHLVLIGIFLIFFIIIQTNEEVKIDEHFNHLPALKSLYQDGPAYILSENYKAANTPLPYFIGAYTAKLFFIEPSIKLARSLNLIFSFLSCLLFIELTRILKSKSIYLPVFIFLFYPYYLKPSLTYYMMIYGLFFLLLSVFLFYRERLFVSGLSAALGILSQQFLIALPAAFVLFQIYKKIKNHKKINISKLALYSLPLAAPVILFSLWGGLTHPNYVGIHKISFGVYNLTSQFTIIGFFFIPVVFLFLKNTNKKILLVLLLISIVLVIFFSPEWYFRGMKGKITGMTFHIIDLSSFAGSFVPFVIKIVLCFCGFFVLYNAWTKRNNNDTVLFLSILAAVFIILYLFNVVLSERYLAPLITVLYLIILPALENKKVLYLWLSLQVILGSFYAYYWVYLMQSY